MLETPITFWFNPEHFEGSVYGSMPQLIIQTEDELKMITEEIIEASFENIALTKFEKDDKPASLDIDPKYTVHKVTEVDGVGMMDKVGWVDERPKGW